MLQSGIHSEFKRVKRATAKCDLCNQKSRPWINRCPACAKQYCDPCLAAGPDKIHIRSPSDTPVTPDPHLHARSPSTTGAQRPLRRLEAARPASLQLENENQNLLDGARLTPKLGTFAPSPRKFNGGQNLPPWENGITKETVILDSPIKTSEFSDIINNPWNKRPGHTLPVIDLTSASDSDQTINDAIEYGQIQLVKDKVDQDAFIVSEHNRTELPDVGASPGQISASILENVSAASLRRREIVSDAHRLRSVLGVRQYDNDAASSEQVTPQMAADTKISKPNKAPKVVHRPNNLIRRKTEGSQPNDKDEGAEKGTEVTPGPTKRKFGEALLEDTVDAEDAGRDVTMSVAVQSIDEHGSDDGAQDQVDEMEEDDPDVHPILLREIEMHEAMQAKLRRRGMLEARPATWEMLEEEIREGFYWQPRGNEAPSRYPHTLSKDPRVLPSMLSNRTRMMLSENHELKHDGLGIDMLLAAARSMGGVADAAQTKA